MPDPVYGPGWLWDARSSLYGQPQAPMITEDQQSEIDRIMEEQRRLRWQKAVAAARASNPELAAKIMSLLDRSRSDKETSQDYVPVDVEPPTPPLEKEELGYEPDERFSNLDNGIAVGKLSDEQIARIRKQAAEKFPGAAGPARIGEVSGNVTYNGRPISEVNEEWLLEKPIRDLEYIRNTPQVYERDPTALKRAELAAAQSAIAMEQKRQRTAEATIDSYTSQGKKVPEMVAARLEQQLGYKVPGELVSPSKEKVISGINKIREGVVKDMERYDPMDMNSVQRGQEILGVLDQAEQMALQGYDENYIQMFVLGQRAKIATKYNQGAGPIEEDPTKLIVGVRRK